MNRFEKYAPPGADERVFRNRTFIIGVVCLLIDIMYGFIFIEDAIRELYNPFTEELLENAQLTDFRTLWDWGSIRTTWVYVIYLPIQAIENYTYFHKNSKSIYIMARIRSPWEIHIRCWTLPLLGMALLVGSKMLLRTVLFVIYVLATPAGVPKPGFEQLIGGLL